VQVDARRDEQLLDGNVQGQRGKGRDVDNFLAELWRDHCAKDLDEHPDPATFVDDIEFLQSLANRPAQDVVCLQVPSHARTSLLLGRGALGLSSSEEDNLVFFACNQLFLSWQSGEYIG